MNDLDLRVTMEVERYKNEFCLGKPTKLLLGHAEQTELFEMWMGTAGRSLSGMAYMGERIKFLEDKGDRRLEYKGLKVYKVDDDSYCQVVK